MRYVRYCLDVLTKPTPCDVPWDAMEGTECERTCLRCDKQVYDVTAMDPLYADDFLREHMPKPPRIELRRRPDGRLLVQECGPGSRQRIMNGIGAVLVAVALGAALLAVVR